MIDISGMPRTNLIVIEDSNWCNMQCPYCPHWRKRTQEERQLLSTEALIKVYELANEIRKQQGYIQVEHLFTEPLLNWQNLKAALEQVNTKYLTNELITNGLLLDDEKMLFLMDHFFRVNISFDGIFQDNRMRNTKERIESIIKAYPYCFSILCTIPYQVSTDDFRRNLDYFLSLPIKSVNLSGNHNYVWSKNDFVQLLQIMLEYDERDRNKMALGGIYGKRPPQIWPTSHRENALFVASDAKIYQMLDNNEHLEPLGNIFAPNLHFPDKEIIRHINNHGCIDCPWEKVCSPTNATATVVVGDYFCNRKKAYAEVFELKEYCLKNE